MFTNYESKSVVDKMTIKWKHQIRNICAVIVVIGLTLAFIMPGSAGFEKTKKCMICSDGEGNAVDNYHMFFEYDQPPDARWVTLGAETQGKNPEITVLESDCESTVIDVTVPGFWVADRRGNEQVFQELRIPEHTTTMEVGKPAVPTIHAAIAVPYNAEVRTRILASSSEVLFGYHVVPFQPQTIDAVKGDQEFAIDQAFYDADITYPFSLVETGIPGIWRDLRVVIVEIAPVRFNPCRDELIVHTHLTIEVSYYGSDRAFLRDSEEGISSRFASLYRNRVLNYDWLNVEERMIGEPGEPQYLIITHPNFEAAIQPLAEWHHREGMKTEVVAIATSDKDEIKELITDRYQQRNLEYVLLVGDKQYMPGYCWPTEDGADCLLSDYWYACIDGDDMWPEVAVGRLSVLTNQQAMNQVAKILAYEKEPPLTEWLNKMLFVAHREDAPGKYVECKEYIRTNIIPPQPPYVVDSLYGHVHGVTNDDVTAAINVGCHIVNYRGHGVTEAWEGWNRLGQYWSTSNVNSLSNGNYTPIVFNIACSCHFFKWDSLGEAWLNKYPGGAVGSLGATRPSARDANHDYDKELFRQFLEHDEYRLGWICNAAATYIITHYEDAGKDNAKMYCWLGDPATEIWTAIPESLTVVHPDMVPTGPSTMDVTITTDGTPVEGAVICLSQEHGIYTKRVTDNTGSASFTICPFSEDSITIVVSAHNYLPYEGIIEVYAGFPAVPLNPSWYQIPQL